MKTKKPKNNDHHFSVRIDKNLYEEIKKIVHTEKIKWRNIIESELKKYLQDYKEKNKL